MRLELIHPMLVHFPIALLITGVAVRFMALWADKRPALSFLLTSAWMILTLGVLTAWTAVIAGEIARDIVAPTLENIKELDEHREHAYITAIGFTLGLFMDWARVYLVKKKKKKGWLTKKGLAIVVWLLYLFSLTNLIITASYGAVLVYEEGAAVK